MNLRTLSLDSAGFVFTNRLHIALLPLFLTLFWNLALRLPLPPDYYLMIMLTTLGGYIYNIHTDGAEDAHNYRSRYRVLTPGARLTRLAIFACFAGGFLLSLRAGWVFVLYGGVVHLLASLYSRPLPLQWRGRVLRIKEVPFVKNLYAGLFWSVVLILTPYLYVGQSPGELAVLAILGSLGMNYFVELMWDVRDMAGDARAGFRTVPLVIGLPATYGLLRLVHLLTCGLVGGGALAGWLPLAHGVVAGLHLPLGWWFLSHYWRLPDKEWASHLYLIYCGTLLLIGIALGLSASPGATA